MKFYLQRTEEQRGQKILLGDNKKQQFCEALFWFSA